MNGQGGPEQSVYFLDKIGFSLLIDSVALMNHSCCPNVIVTYKGTLAEVRAVQEISPGEEVSVWPLGRGPALPTAALKGGVGASAQRRWVARAASDASSYSVSIVRPGRSVSRVVTRGFESRAFAFRSMLTVSVCGQGKEQERINSSSIPYKDR